MVRAMEQCEGLQECWSAQNAEMVEYKEQREKILSTFDENAGFRKWHMYCVSQGDQIFWRNRKEGWCKKLGLSSNLYICFGPS